MNDGAIRCGHGNPAKLIPRPDLGEGWVEPVAETCPFCNSTDPDRPGLKPIPYKPGVPMTAPKAEEKKTEATVPVNRMQIIFDEKK